MSTVLNAPVFAEVPTPAFRPGPAGTHITIRGLTKYFAGWPLYENFDLDIPKGKIVSVFGPNGCGKSTLINMIAGLIPIDSGEILFDGKSLKDTKIGYVFQNYREALFPWLRSIANSLCYRCFHHHKYFHQYFNQSWCLSDKSFFDDSVCKIAEYFQYS